MSEEKLNELKEKVANLQEEIRELAPEELEQVFGGAGNLYDAGVNISIFDTHIGQFSFTMPADGSS